MRVRSPPLKPLIVPAWFGEAFFIFLLRQYIMTIPMEIDEAARIAEDNARAAEQRAANEAREAAERAGVSAFMTKPFANADIRAAVRDLLGA